MIRAAIYARFSDDSQNEKSVDDQIAFCREIAAREGWAVVATFDDPAISGASAINRPGFNAMLRAAEARLFDILIAEDVDRITRDQGDWHAARKRLDFAGVSIFTANGKVTKIDGALRALMGEMFLENLALHTRRGLEAVIRDGRSAGGRSYGYKPVPGKAGELEIVQGEAEVIRRIFDEYIAGKTPREIAVELNAANIPPPRGARWNATTLNGNFARGYGILANATYSGRIIWNKVRMIKDPMTGKRISRPNPPEQHRTAIAEHLRIITDETWKAAQAVKAKKHRQPSTNSRAPRRAFSGLIICGSCGSGMSSIGKDKSGTRVQCSAHRESGTCENGRRVHVETIENVVLSGLRSELENPLVITEYVKAYNEERRRLRKEAGNDQAKLERQASERQRELNNLINSIAAGVPATTIAPRITAIEAELAGIRARLAQVADDEKIVALHPTALQRYTGDIAALATLLASNPDNQNTALFEAVRDLVAAIVVYAPPRSEDLRIELRGRLAELCDAEIFPSGTIINSAENRRAASGGFAGKPHRHESGGSMVAREGLEPPTPGL